MISFGILAGLLMVGVMVRRKVKWVQRLFLPASVVGGLIGLLVWQGLRYYDISVHPSLTAGWNTLPGLLINVVFAALFMGERLPKLKTVWKSCSRQLAYGQLVAWGQYAVGCLIVLLLLGPWFGLPDVYAGIMPVGFEGGHGTAGGMAPVFDSLGFPEIKELALAAATFGILGAIIMGMALVNWAIRRGLVASHAPAALAERRAAGTLTISSDIVGTLSLQLAFVGLAILLGWIFKESLLKIASALPGRWGELMASFPLFPLCMLGGVIVQLFCDAFDRSKLVCRGLMLQVQNAALDFLVVAAIVTIQLDIVAAGWVPLVLLVVGGVLWNFFCLRVIAPRVFNDAWFERAIAELGQSMGVTATGLLLLRTVDPDCETEAASAFASKQLLHEPFMGGGLWTGLAIPLLALWGGWPVLGIVLGVMFLWSLSLFIMQRKRATHGG